MSPQKNQELLNLNTKIIEVFEGRARVAQQHFADNASKAFKELAALKPSSPWETCMEWSQYGVDFFQRSVLFWETMRQRGVNYLNHERAGKPPVLHFDYQMVMDARKFPRPVNYALVQIIPPEGMTIDPGRRPYIIIDPRAGHGPGIGGFKDDSQVGAALREGHPVYFVIFFPRPEPGQMMQDVTAAQQEFVHKVRQLHPRSPKPAIVGNCQGGWAAMMLASSDPDDTGPVVINGAPMSYWGGAWSEGGGDNPMRYSGGLLGGTWLASLFADLGNGIFDGAWLAENFESLDPANTFWDKPYHLFANVDTEPPRFLDFERWWGGYFLLNREEIEWITQNLFVGNKLWSGKVNAPDGQSFDLREIKSPIVLFASLGDNITPPQQAFNWVADIYGSTDEIKARGQVIVGLVHQSIGHLGIFVSGRVAKKEHKQIVSVLKSIEALPPGLYGMQIDEHKRAEGGVDYEVRFVEHRLEEVIARLNRFKRVDEKAFEAVEEYSKFNQYAYELYARPLVQAMSNEVTADLSRRFHPLRVQHWAISDLNPWLAWLGPAAEMVKARRQALGPEAPPRQLEQFYSKLVSASLDFYRDIRDAASEAMFFETYGNLFLSRSNGSRGESEHQKPITEPRDLPFVKEALDSMAKGGYPEAVARIFALLRRHGTSVPLEMVHLRRELREKFADLLPRMAPVEERRIHGLQDIIVRYQPEQALQTLPRLLANQNDRRRLVALLEGVIADERVWRGKPTAEQIEMLSRIQKLLGDTPSPRRATGAGSKQPRPGASRRSTPRSRRKSLWKV